MLASDTLTLDEQEFVYDPNYKSQAPKATGGSVLYNFFKQV
jgi:hypothetical protein